MLNIEAFSPPEPLWSGTAAGWLDAYASARSRLRPTEKPSETMAAAHAAHPTQGAMAPWMIAYLECELGPLQA